MILNAHRTRHFILYILLDIGNPIKINRKIKRSVTVVRCTTNSLHGFNKTKN